MSVREGLIAAVLAGLDDRGADDALTVFDAPPVRAAMPYAVIEEPVLSAIGASGIEGVEARIAITVTDGGERPVRLRRLIAGIEARMAALPERIADADGDWRAVVRRLIKSRITRAKAGHWIGTSEFMVRAWRAEGEA